MHVLVFYCVCVRLRTNILFGGTCFFLQWIVRRQRPNSIGESDSDLRDIFNYIFQGGYTLPTYKLVTQYILALSVEGRAKVKKLLLFDLAAEGILPSIAGDVWSEGGVSIFGILTDWLDTEMRYHEKLLAAIPFIAVRHTDDEILLATKRACSKMGIGSFVESPNEFEVIDTVTTCVHSTASESASNIVCGWKEFDAWSLVQLPHSCPCT
ncbi:hypothetical protein CYMTET_46696 [Cymbomonas tetramitiformis]|uniref:Uncharacterized protein n=1 Tax=Cymbomonas tetramitiformis TaxID=36881 RepID=A0AAE0BVS4_9CHLO|nr:hypothetical protein CYMTET_46696 [Cymbomonas tetramitiformis]